MPKTAVLVHDCGNPIAATERFRVSMAQTLEDVIECQRLRYLVFNCELEEGLDTSAKIGLDRDRFDFICDHLMVQDAGTGRLAGTYRMQSGYRAEVALGAVSALHAVGSGQPSGARVLHHQMVADEIEAVAVQSYFGGGVQSLLQLAIKNQITQPLALDNVFQRLGHANPETFRCGDGISAIVNEDSGFWHASSVKQSRLQTCFRNVI